MDVSEPSDLGTAVAAARATAVASSFMRSDPVGSSKPASCAVRTSPALERPGDSDGCGIAALRWACDQSNPEPGSTESVTRETGARKAAGEPGPATEPGEGDGVGEAGDGTGGAETGVVEGEGEGETGTGRGVLEIGEKDGSGPRVVPVIGTWENNVGSDGGPELEAEDGGPRIVLPPGPDPGGAEKNEEPETEAAAEKEEPGRAPKTTGRIPRWDSNTRNWSAPGMNSGLSRRTVG